MCFRPASAGLAVQCPECKTFNKPTATSCQKCGFAVEMDESTEAPAMKAPAIKAPGNAPGNAPVMPKAPGAPKPPTSKGPDKPHA